MDSIDALRTMINDQLDSIIRQATALRQDRVRPDIRPGAAGQLCESAEVLAVWEARLRELRLQRHEESM